MVQLKSKDPGTSSMSAEESDIKMVGVIGYRKKENRGVKLAARGLDTSCAGQWWVVVVF